MTPNPGAQTKRPPGIGDNGGWVNGVFYKLFFTEITMDPREDRLIKVC
jgi:hypothetical protein